MPKFTKGHYLRNRTPISHPATSRCDKNKYSCLDNVCTECDSSTCSCVTDYTVCERNINDTSRALSACSFVTSLYSQHTKSQCTFTGKKNK